METWKDIPGYENLYEVSNKGKVCSKVGKVTYTERHGKRVWKSRVLKEKNTKGRDIRFDLWKDGKPKSYLAHRLVAAAFIPNPENKPCINHLDGNPRNNDVRNLEWATYEENQNHAFDNGLTKTNINIILKETETEVMSCFRSMAKASEFLGRNNGYVSDSLNKGKEKVKSVDGRKYEVYMPVFTLNKRVGD